MRKSPWPVKHRARRCRVVSLDWGLKPDAVQELALVLLAQEQWTTAFEHLGFYFRKMGIITPTSWVRCGSNALKHLAWPQPQMTVKCPPHASPPPTLCLGTQWALNSGCRRGCSLSKSAPQSPLQTSPQCTPAENSPVLPAQGPRPAERNPVRSPRSSQAGGLSEWCRQRPAAAPGQGWKLLFANRVASGNMGLPALGVPQSTSQT